MKVLKVCFAALVLMYSLSVQAETSVSVGVLDGLVLRSGVPVAEGAYPFVSFKKTLENGWYGKVWLGGNSTSDEAGKHHKIDTTLGKKFLQTNLCAMSASLTHSFARPLGDEPLHSFVPGLSGTCKLTDWSSLSGFVLGVYVPQRTEFNGYIVSVGVGVFERVHPKLKVGVSGAVGFDDSYLLRRSFLKGGLWGEYELSKDMVLQPSVGIWKPQSDHSEVGLSLQIKHTFE